MIRVNQLKIPILELPRTAEGKTDREGELLLLKKRAAKLLGVRADGIRKLRIVRRSIDAREKNNILFVYTLRVRLHDSITGPTAETEEAFVKKLRNKNLVREDAVPFTPPVPAEETRAYFLSEGHRPVIAGAGPCGLFAALILAEAGLKPLVIERGAPAEERVKTLDRFFETGKLDPASNVQFGEGGAGMFSDGKLNTSVKGQAGSIRYVLETFVRFGADKEILTDQKPHIGTDLLTEVVKRMREAIIAAGGEFRFHTRLTAFETGADGRLQAILTERSGHGAGDARRMEEDKASAVKRIPTDCCILAIGHSARDTFAMLKAAKVQLEQKSFAMGVRIQHPQQLIDSALYGADRLEEKQALLGPASYKLVHSCQNGRSIYSFCMCPGGYVVNSSSEEGRLCVNGMSYHDRASGTANAALIVNITPADFPSEDPLSGIELQRELEEKAYRLADGMIPYETWDEFKRSEKMPCGVTKTTEPRFKGYAAPADVRSILPSFMREALLEGMGAFGRQIPGFDGGDAVVAGIEARTSSPVRIVRGESGESSMPGLYPAGEGAGYAGGITSAAVDGIRAAIKLLDAAHH